jgi:hypothetical protein
MSTFEFVVVSSLRAAQLMRGCTSRVEGDHKVIVTAQLEVASGAVVGAFVKPVKPGDELSLAIAAPGAELVPASLILSS